MLALLTESKSSPKELQVSPDQGENHLALASAANSTVGSSLSHAESSRGKQWAGDIITARLWTVRGGPETSTAFNQASTGVSGPVSHCDASAWLVWLRKVTGPPCESADKEKLFQNVPAWSFPRTAHADRTMHGCHLSSTTWRINAEETD